MPGVARGDMNGYRDFEQGHLRTSSYAKDVTSPSSTRLQTASSHSVTSPKIPSGYDPYRRDKEDFSPPPLRKAPGSVFTSDYHRHGRMDYHPPTSRSDIMSARSHRDGGGYRRHNGVDDLEQNSFEFGMRDGNEPMFEVDHLATYTSKSGTTHPEDGLTKLKQMESTTGIWTMRCTMTIERRYIVIIDKGSGDELERFPLPQVHEPTAVLKNDRRETYNNLVLFTVIDDPKRRNSPSDMHIFQSVNAPAHDIVDEILAAKGEAGGRRGPYDRQIPPPPMGPPSEPPGKFSNYRETTKYSSEHIDRDEPLESRFRDTQIAETSRYTDASRWIHDYYTQGRNGSRSPSPVYATPKKRTESMRLSLPSTSDPYIYPRSSTGEITGSNTLSRSQTLSNVKTKKANPYGTWSGRDYGDSLGTGKKKNKWYKFGLSKNTFRKTNKGKENRGYLYQNATLPLRRSTIDDGLVSTKWQGKGTSTDSIDGRQDWRWFGTGRFMGASRVGDFRASYIHRDDMDTGQNEALERDVQLLNNCFDDIEKFVSRLQAAAEAYKELERRKMERGNKRKNKSAGEGMLMMRARPPPAEDFVDIFQKFKFGFNLLAKLKAHIHDPNAPELVHFLFTPLSLIYEASRDPIHGGKDLGSEAVAPLLLPEAKQLLVNCLTSKELELWQRLGRPWTLVKDEFNGYVPPYNPKFYNGWQPSPQMVDEVNNGERFSQTERYRDDALRATSGGGGFRDDALRATSAVGGGAAYVPYVIEDRYSRREDPYRRDDFRATERRDDYRSTERRDDYRTTERRDDYRPSTPPSRSQEYVDRYSDRNKRTNPPREALPPAPKSKSEQNQDYAQELKRMGATIYEAVHERTGKNQKELTVEKGDILQVLDKSRNWWKLRNHQGETGYAPYTILAEYQSSDGPGQGRLSGDYSSYINGNAPPPAPPPMVGSSRAGSRADVNRSQEVQYARPRNPPDVPKRPDNRNRHKDDMHLELQARLNTSDDKYYSSSPRSPVPSPRGQQPPMPPQSRPGRQGPTNLSQDSTVYDVQDWLEGKGFSRRCMDLLNGYNGEQVFSLDRLELERLLGHDEGRHLDSLLIVQKNNSGYRTRGTSELRAILQHRKTHVETQNQRENRGAMGTKPSFMPDTPPDYSDSEASSDDFGNAGKTLRNLLERQRKKIQSGYYKDRQKNY